MSSFDWKQYLSNYPDLQKAGINNNRLALLHYNLHGKHENRTDNSLEKKCILFHIGKLEIAYDIIKKYPDFFSRGDVYVSCHSNNVEKNISKKIKVKKFFIIENRGMDIGGFFNIMNYLKINKIFYDKYIKIHTKTNEVWRNKLIQPLYKYRGTKINNQLPYIYQSEENTMQNRKNHINIDILKKYNINLNCYLDSYHCNSGLDFNSSFYKHYETDLSNYNEQLLINHYNNHGKNEFHRISNIHYIKSHAIKESMFVPGTMFIFNKRYCEILNKFDYLQEFKKMEPGYVIHNSLTITHSWEYFFGHLSYYYSGCIINFDNTPIINKLIKIPKMSILNVPINHSKIAFFMIPSGNEPISGGYRTLLKYIRYLNDSGLSVDMYFGICWNDNDVLLNTKNEGIFGIPSCSNWYNEKTSIDNLINNISKYNEINISKNNYYISFKLQRNYHIIVSNAWQVAKAGYLQKSRCKKLAYIIQDREELFYPGNNILQNEVLSTYKPEYSYYCLSGYLTNHFKSQFTRSTITQSKLTFNKNDYYDLNKNRENGIILAYYKGKPGRLPQMIEKIIDILSTNYKCYVFPDKYNGNENVINCGTMSVPQLNNLYNSQKIGIIFSNTNPSRLGFEMKASCLHVIEYQSEFTKYDLPTKYFTKILNYNNIINKINWLLTKPNTTDQSFINEYNNDHEKNNLIQFFNILLN